MQLNGAPKHPKLQAYAAIEWLLLESEASHLCLMRCSHLQHRELHKESFMSVHEPHVSARTLAVIVAVALVATAMAPLLFVAARIVA